MLDTEKKTVTEKNRYTRNNVTRRNVQLPYTVASCPKVHREPATQSFNFRSAVTGKDSSHVTPTTSTSNATTLVTANRTNTTIDDGEMNRVIMICMCIICKIVDCFSSLSLKSILLLANYYTTTKRLMFIKDNRR